jgi:hypothetical protein
LEQLREFSKSTKGDVLMMGFLEWVEYDRKKKEKEQKNVRTTSQSNQEIGVVSHQGKATGDDSKIYTTVVHDFTQSKWEDYRGGD